MGDFIASVRDDKGSVALDGSSSNSLSCARGPEGGARDRAVRSESQDVDHPSMTAMDSVAGDACRGQLGGLRRRSVMRLSTQLDFSAT